MLREASQLGFSKLATITCCFASHGERRDILLAKVKLLISKNVRVLGPKEEFIDEVGISVTAGAFKKCNSLEMITVSSLIPPIGAEFSSDAYSNAVLFVPENTKDVWY